MLPAEQTAPALSPASAVALALRRARARLARRFPGRSAADRDDADPRAAALPSTIALFLGAVLCESGSTDASTRGECVAAMSCTEAPASSVSVCTTLRSAGTTARCARCTGRVHARD